MTSQCLSDSCPRPELQKTWDALGPLRNTGNDLSSLFRQDPQRSTRYQARAAGLCLDYARQPVSDEILSHLFALAHAAGTHTALQALVRGDIVNNTEGRAATHVPLRDPGHAGHVAAARQRWAWADAVRNGQHRTGAGERITDVVNIGIGGSHLGPALAVSALATAAGPRCHFVSNVDPQELDALLPQLPAATTLWIVSSKSFGTQETQVNAKAAFEWMDRNAPAGWRAQQLAVVSANSAAARKLGAKDEQVFGITDSVGGRYSIWSAVDLPVAITLGSEAMQALHRGAHAIDQNALGSEPAQNLPLLLALLALWNRNFLGRPALAVVAYDSRLDKLPDYLQQLVMESNGKSVNREGKPVGCSTSPVLWGGVGTNGQHSYHQCLHQGTDVVPVEFLVPATGSDGARHDYLIANALAQSHALAFGSTSPLADNKADDPLAAHRHMPGNRPSSLLFYRALTAETLGSLIALYEHKTFFESVIWGINPFDQWGVELGKRISNCVYDALHGDRSALPADLQASIASLDILRR